MRRVIGAWCLGWLLFHNLGGIRLLGVRLLLKILVPRFGDSMVSIWLLTAVFRCLLPLLILHLGCCFGGVQM